MEVLTTNDYSPNGLRLDGWSTLWKELDRAVPRHVTPAADVVEDAEAYRFYFEMPGLKADSVDLKIEDGRLTIEAERKRPEWPKEAELHLSERSYGRMHRAFELPDNAGQENIKAVYKDGVLEVTVPKRPESKPVKIKVEN